MRVTRDPTKKDEFVHKAATTVGVMYTHRGFPDKAFFRCQGGFANMDTGQYIGFEEASSEGWRPEPGSVVVLPSA